MVPEAKMALSREELDRARSNFNIDGGLIFLNHASHGPLPNPARAAYDRYLDSWQKTSHEHDVESFQIIEEARRKLASMISAEPERVGLSNGTSFGFNIVAGGYPWKSGDNVVVSRCEFPAVVYPWKRLESGEIELRFVSCDNGFIDEEAMIAAADDKTRVICVSWVQFYNGYRSDLAKLGRFCRENNILFCVDGIQGMGAVPIDVPSSDIDLFTCGCQKWMLGPCGTGFFYLSERAENILGIPLYGWLSVDWGVEFSNLMRYDLPSRKGPAKYEISTYAFQDIRALEASIDLLQSFDSIRRWDHIRALTDMISDEVDSNKNFKLASSREESRRSGILNIKAADSKKLFDFLTGKGISVSYREGGIRVSPHFYNSPDEIDFFIEALEQFRP